MNSLIKDKVPPRVKITPFQDIRDYWAARANQHLRDCYMGVPMMKLPEDLRVYEHLLQLSGANVVVELGSFHGGSALWFRDRLRTLHEYGRIQDYRVITLDLYPDRTRGNLAVTDPNYQETITVLRGDVTKRSSLDRVTAALARVENARPLIIEDSAHTYETTRAALHSFADLVPAGSFYVVEDGYLNVDDYEFLPQSSRRDVLPAVREYLAANKQFELCRQYEFYGITSHPEGILRRRP